MTSFAEPMTQGRLSRTSGSFILSAMFMAFCYVLLSWRAVLLNDAAPIFSERRTLALLVGTGLFWLVLKRLDSAERITLARTASWIVAATALVLCVRVFLDWLMPAVSLTLSYSIRWSLAWGAYFGLWVMGATAFRRRQARLVPLEWADTITGASLDSRVAAASPDDVEWLVDVLSPELENLEPAVRGRLADRLLSKAGRYELADELDPWNARHNSRLRLAHRIAGKIRKE